MDFKLEGQADRKRGKGVKGGSSLNLELEPVSLKIDRGEKSVECGRRGEYK